VLFQGEVGGENSQELGLIVTYSSQLFSALSAFSTQLSELRLNILDRSCPWDGLTVQPGVTLPGPRVGIVRIQYMRQI